MKKILTGILLFSAANITYADCSGSWAYGQYNEDCDTSVTSNNERTTEFTQIPYSANKQISKHKTEKERLASLEQSVNQAQTTQSPFKPTHTQLDQVRQLLEYAQSQGCTWKGMSDKPLLVCPE